MSRRTSPQPLPRTVPPTSPRLAICRCPAVITVLGTRKSYAVTAGAQVDLDDIVGESAGVPLTLAEALGPHLTQFELVRPAAASPAAPANDAENQE